MASHITAANARVQRAKIGAWMGLFVFALNLAMSVILATPATAASGAPLPSFDQIASGERIVVCTATGLIILDENGDPVSSERPGGGHARPCALCLPTVNGGMAAFDTAPIFPKPDNAPITLWFAPYADRATIAWLVRVHGPRAPPHSHI